MFWLNIEQKVTMTPVVFSHCSTHTILITILPVKLDFLIQNVSHQQMLMVHKRTAEMLE